MAKYHIVIVFFFEPKRRQTIPRESSYQGQYIKRVFRKNRNFRPQYFAVSWKRHKRGQWLQRSINRKSHTQV